MALHVKSFKRASILYNKETESKAFRLGLAIEVNGIRPGHFYMLRRPGTIDPLLSRPLGVYRLINAHGAAVPGAIEGSAYSSEGVEFLYNVVGRGTTLLTGMTAGEELSLLGPLGNGFPLPKDRDADKTIMVGGGMGIVPFYLMASLMDKGVFLFGARGAGQARLARDFSGFPCRVEVATEDGSVGTKGLVTDLLERELSPDSVVYACGPPAMLKRVAAMAAERGVLCYVSLEKTMACGIGVCLGCAVKTKAGSGHGLNGADGGGGRYRMVCSEGPVFESTLVDWDDIY
ncbi:MAG: dihydroorotate dehydrogenase electron transfer subunit [Thermodesulfobacteriota bacterium]